MGAECPALYEYGACNTQPCSVDCVVSDWKEWSECSATCGGGTTSREREVLQEAQAGGRACPTLSEEALCNPQECEPVHCEVSEWGEWGQCSALCGGGVRSRERAVVVQPDSGGESCPVLSEMASCNEEPCPPPL